MPRTHRFSALVLALLAFLPQMAFGQDAMQPPADQAAPPSGAPTAPQQVYSPQQLDQLVAPIALYPDDLLGQVLMASTYPLEVVEASRWRQDPANANLPSDQLGAALAQQSWDPSVKSLVQFPQVLSMMDQNLQWTEQVGDAFLAQQADVSNSVQNLRQRAQAAGHLQSTPQQTVQADQGAIVIQPAQPNVVYVPTYNPQAVYGAWPYPAYPPYYFPPPPGFYYSAPGILAFGIGIGVVDLFWGWDRWDWHNHRIFIDHDRFAEINRGRAPFGGGDSWEHNPFHRHGVPYASPAVRSRFAAEQTAARQNFRGFDNAHNNAHALTGATPRGGLNANAGRAALPVAANRGINAASSQQHTQFQRASATPQVSRDQVERAQRQNTSNVATPRIQQGQSTGRSQFQAASRAQAQPQRQIQAPRHSAPVFESYSRGSEVRAQAQRGAVSRASTPAPQVQRAAPQQRSAPQQHAAPSGGGNRGGGGDEHGRNH